MINVPLQRIRVSEKDIFEFVTKYKNRLILPDQDILNGLYGKEIKKIDEIKYNFDVRYYQLHKILSNGEFDMDYIMRNTFVDQIDTADEIVFIIESPDKMTQPFRCIRRKMVDEIELVFGKQAGN